MRVIIEPDYAELSRWAAEYVAAKINAANPTPEKPFKLGCSQLPRTPAEHFYKSNGNLLRIVINKILKICLLMARSKQATTIVFVMLYFLNK